MSLPQNNLVLKLIRTKRLDTFSYVSLLIPFSPFKVFPITKSVEPFRLSNGGCGKPYRNKRPIHHTRLNMMYRNTDLHRQTMCGVPSSSFCLETATFPFEITRKHFRKNMSLISQWYKCSQKFRYSLNYVCFLFVVTILLFLLELLLLKISNGITRKRVQVS